MENESSLTVASPGGWKAKFAGTDTRTILVALLVLACTALVSYMWEQGRKSDIEARANFKESHKVTQALLGNVITNQQVIMEQLREERKASSAELGEITYILTLSQEKRDKLKLEMPNSLRKKMNGQ